MEAFFRSLKTDWSWSIGYASQGQAEADVLRYLMDYYINLHTATADTERRRKPNHWPDKPEPMFSFR